MDHAIGSARAEQRKAPIIRHIIRSLLTASLASALTLPSLAAWGLDSPQKQTAGQPSATVTLPPIPYLDSMPWMKWNAPTGTLKIDTLIAPGISPLGLPPSPEIGKHAVADNG